MKIGREVIIYGLYVLSLILFVGGAMLTPFLAHEHNPVADTLYGTYKPACHQKISRSQCVFKDSSGGFSVGDCTNQSGEFVADDQKQKKNVVDNSTGYKIGVCARDTGIYGFMLLAALVYPFVFKLDNKKMLPPIIFIAAIIPIGLDGGLQFLSTLGLFGIEYESINIVRFITGAIVGAAITVYALPILNKMFN